MHDVEDIRPHVNKKIRQGQRVGSENNIPSSGFLVRACLVIRETSLHRHNTFIVYLSLIKRYQVSLSISNR